MPLQGLAEEQAVPNACWFCLYTLLECVEMPTRARRRKGGRKATATVGYWYQNSEQHPYMYRDLNLGAYVDAMVQKPDLNAE